MFKQQLLKTVFLLTLFITLSQACKTSKNMSKVYGNNSNGLTVFQNNKELPLKHLYDSVEIERKKFSLRFYNKQYDSENKAYYSAQIAAFIDKNEFNKIKTGMPKSETSCFSPGSGMAPAKSGKYESLIFNKYGHHYAFYENPESKRLNLIDDTGERLKLEFEINALHYNNKDVNIENSNLDVFYIALFIDQNLNGIIDKGELNKLVIKFK